MYEYKQLGASHVIREVGGKIRCVCYEEAFAKRILDLLQPPPTPKCGVPRHALDCTCETPK